MTNSNRRTFMLHVAATGAVLCAAQARAQTTAKVDEADPQAVALGYKADGSKVDAAKYPKHVAAQTCASCQLFQGKPGDASGPCTLFALKQVPAAGWCSAWVKKPG